MPGRKDMVVIRSDVNPSQNDSPFLKYPDQVRDYFEQYGNCETIYDTHTTRGGLVTYTVVLQFRLTDNANRVKQKYNGKVLKGSRVTTSWLDSRQFRELGMPDVLKHNITTTNSSLMKERQGKGKHGSFPRGKAGWGRGRGRGRSPVLTSDQEFVYSSRSQSGPDSESLEGFGFCLQQHLPSIPSGQISSSKFQDVPKGVDVKRERLELLERPDSRTSSHSQSSWGEGDREGSRKRRESSPPAKYTPTAKGKVVDDADRGEKGSDKKKATTRMLYVPRSKRKREEISEAPSVDAKGLKSVFDRLGPTKAQEKDIHQLETYGELAAKKSKPNDSIVLSPTISKSPGKEESPARPSSTGSEKESGKPGGGPDEDSKKEKMMRSSEGDERKDRSSKHGSEHDSSRHSKGKKSRKRSTSSIEKKRSKSDKKERRSCDREKEKTKQVVGESLVQNTWREVPTSLALAPNETSAFMDDPGTPPLPPEVPSLAQGQSTVPRYDEAQWLEYCRQITSHREQEHGKETSQTVGSDLNTPGPVVNGEQVPSQSEVPLPNEQVRGKRPKENARLGLKKIDSATASATLQEFDSQALLLATTTKLLVSHSPYSHEELHHSMEAAVWQLANTLLAKLKE